MINKKNNKATKEPARATDHITIKLLDQNFKKYQLIKPAIIKTCSLYIKTSLLHDYGMSRPSLPEVGFPFL